MGILVLILTVVLPPLGVAIGRGNGTDIIINLVLTLLGWVPGVIHGIWVNYAR
ncbi:YqaE/Pmp3 family membrane protein [Pacificimonas flava]|uniref:YqaE/Pmp3 family membrane protein n=1 Tax=Pacificimonas flava TaxID=1234595 RepID=M2SDS0_9SPHN|nr:YqaE/Pmp3 family membrane protein [Pacificimonas flava]EMD83515.1 hypothetical protein C725_1416 [Pacificimonas flava]MBB5278933.1 uncharacterized membrane protein YqaE (UPF0057 family) [Pacificimonas flava]